MDRAFLAVAREDVPPRCACAAPATCNCNWNLEPAITSISCPANSQFPAPTPIPVVPTPFPILSLLLLPLLTPSFRPPPQQSAATTLPIPCPNVLSCQRQVLRPLRVHRPSSTLSLNRNLSYKQSTNYLSGTQALRRTILSHHCSAAPVIVELHSIRVPYHRLDRLTSTYHSCNGFKGKLSLVSSCRSRRCISSAFNPLPCCVPHRLTIIVNSF